jgi:hypothetical protein
MKKKDLIILKISLIQIFFTKTLFIKKEIKLIIKIMLVQLDKVINKDGIVKWSVTTKGFMFNLIKTWIQSMTDKKSSQ